MKILFYLAVVAYVGTTNVSAAAIQSEEEFVFDRKVPAIPGHCQLEPKPGICRAYLARYYFSPKQNRCIFFVYGGCDGNRNNFRTEEECEMSCLGWRPSPFANRWWNWNELHNKKSNPRTRFTSAVEPYETDVDLDYEEEKEEEENST